MPPDPQQIPEPTFTPEQTASLADLADMAPTLRYMQFDAIADAVWDDDGGHEAA